MIWLVRLTQLVFDYCLRWADFFVSGWWRRADGCSPVRPGDQGGQDGRGVDTAVHRRGEVVRGVEHRPRLLVQAEGHGAPHPPHGRGEIFVWKICLGTGGYGG